MRRPPVPSSRAFAFGAIASIATATITLGLPPAHGADSPSMAAPFSPPPADWHARRGCDKQRALWEQGIGTTRHAAGSLPELAGPDVLGLLLGRMKVKVETRDDFAPEGWKKIIHRRASVAKVRLEPVPGSPFTGVFRGAECGLLRLSLTSAPGDDEVNPGLALKILRDGAPSADVSALVSLDGQGADFNIFAREYSNFVMPSDRLKLKVSAAVFRRASRHPNKVSFKGFGEVKADGSAEAAGTATAPVRVFFVPGEGVATPREKGDFREALARAVPAGTTVFRLFAVFDEKNDEPSLEAVDATLADPAHRSRAREFARIVTTSPFVVSAFGDDRLFFRHETFKGE